MSLCCSVVNWTCLAGSCWRWTARGSKTFNNKNRNFTRKTLTQFIKAADAKLEDYLQRLDKRDANESGTCGSRVENLAEKITAIRDRRERHKDMLAALDRTEESQISLN